MAAEKQVFISLLNYNWNGDSLVVREEKKTFYFNYRLQLGFKPLHSCCCGRKENFLFQLLTVTATVLFLRQKIKSLI
jgi:hypothetical protein